MNELFGRDSDGRCNLELISCGGVDSGRGCGPPQNRRLRKQRRLGPATSDPGVSVEADL